MTTTLAHRFRPLLFTTMLVTSPAFAQPSAAPTAPDTATTAPTGTAPTGTAHKAMPGHGTEAGSRLPGPTMLALADRRIAELHNQLHITPQQEQAWGPFADVMRANAREMDQQFQQRAEHLTSMSAVDNMQSYAQIEQTRAGNVQKLVTSFQGVYASLSAQQKQAADELFRHYADNAARHRQTATR